MAETSELDGCGGELTQSLWPLGVPPVLNAPRPSLMHALVIHREEYGQPIEALHFETMATPCLRPADAKRVLVAVLASGPNFNTNFAALGLPVPVFGRGDTATAHIPGSDALGIVVDAGPAVTGLKVGQAVILDSWTGRNIRGYETHDGFNCQFVLIDEDRALPLPAVLSEHSPARLAAVMLTHGTAYRAVVERMQTKPGDTVLFMGGGKGTSFAGAQIAKRLGARSILVGSNPRLLQGLVDRGIADSFVDRRLIDSAALGPIGVDETYGGWAGRTESFRRAVFQANAGRPVDKIFEHTGGDNFPLLVSALGEGGCLTFFGATGKGLKGEYKETFFYDDRRFVFDARWVWMRQKQVLFRTASPQDVFTEIGLPPGRRGLVWGADDDARQWVMAARDRGTDVAVMASFSREDVDIAELRRLGLPASRLLDRDAFDLPADMPDPLTADGRPDPSYNTLFLKKAQAIGKALWEVWGPRVSPDFVVDRIDQSTLHFSTFVARDFDERDVMPCGHVLLRGPSDLSIRGSHMYSSCQAAEVIRLLATGNAVVEQEDVEIVGLGELAQVQQKMLTGTMEKPKGVALVQADDPTRCVREFEEAYFGRSVRRAAPDDDRYVDVRVLDGFAVVTLSRPSALNALNRELILQLGEVVREVSRTRSVGGVSVRGLVLTGAGRSFVAGADVEEFVGSTARDVGVLARLVNDLFQELETLPLPVVAVIDGFALGGGNELAMSAHYRIATENARFGQPEVKLGIFPGYGGMQRLPRLVGPDRAAELASNGEPIDGQAALDLGLVDELSPASIAVRRAFEVAHAAAEGHYKVGKRDWDALAARQKPALQAFLSRPSVRDLLTTPLTTPDTASVVVTARRAAAAAAIGAMVYGYDQGFEAGLHNDATTFGTIVASPGGQEWVRRFLEKDPAQSAVLTVLASGR